MALLTLEGFFAGDCLGYISAMEFLFPLRDTTNISETFHLFSPPQKNDSSRTERGQQRTRAHPLYQCDPDIHPRLTRMTAGDLNTVFALNKTADAILGARQRHRKDITFL